MKILKSFFLVFTLLIFLSPTSCSENKNHPDKIYFMALRALDHHNEKEARRLFTKGVKNCTPLIARRCAESLVSLGNVRERNEASLNLIKNFGDLKFKENHNSFLIAIRELEKNAEYFTVLQATENLDFEDLNIPNEIFKIRLNCLKEKENPLFEKEFKNYYMTRPLDLKNISEILLNSDFIVEEDLFLQFRLTVAERNYKEAYGNFNDIVALCGETEFFPQIISDLGKAALYGADNLESAAYKFENLLKKMNTALKAEKYVDDVSFYNAHFYAGRLYAKSGNFPRATKNHLLKAMGLVENKNAFQYDNALWYLLNSTLSNSTDDAISLIEKYAPIWSDAKYFDDLFDSLLVMLLSNQSYKKISSIYISLKPFFTDETRSKFAYVTGRLIQEKLLAENQSVSADDCFTDALNSGTEAYYKIMAATKLNLPKDEFEKIMLTSPKKNPAESSEKKSYPNDYDSLLSGYEIFGFPQKIYSEWLSNRDKIGKTAAFKAAQFLETCDSEKNNYGLQGLRIASRVVNGNFKPMPKNSNPMNESATDFTKDQLRLAYPQYFKNEIVAASEKNNLPIYEIFALVRSESFFDPKIRSHAGAVGLTQLMETTATDVARKLKQKDFQLAHLDEPETNINFGTFYLAELITRVENQNILGLFSYNAGISNVRRWAKNIQSDYLKTGGPTYKTTGIAPDLFLEIVPFEETRGYGRKLLAASVIYGWLYDDLDPAQIVDEIFN